MQDLRMITPLSRASGFFSHNPLACPTLVVYHPIQSGLTFSHPKHRSRSLVLVSVLPRSTPFAQFVFFVFFHNLCLPVSVIQVRIPVPFYFLFSGPQYPFAQALFVGALPVICHFRSGSVFLSQTILILYPCTACFPRRQPKSPPASTPVPVPFPTIVILLASSFMPAPVSPHTYLVSRWSAASLPKTLLFWARLFLCGSLGQRHVGPYFLFR